MWLIDATGRRARIARQQGAHRCRDDGLVALYTWAVSGPGDTDTRTLIEAVPYGWWYTARLPDGARIVALHVDAKDAIAILHDPRGFESKLAETIHLRPLFEGRQFLTKARGTEAGGARLDRFMGLGWLAAGDAALSFDPLSSQGIFAALYTGMRAGQAVVGALSGNTIGLEAYNARLDSIRAAYLSQHRRQYQMERRWPKHEFWLERGAQSGGLDNAELMLGAPVHEDRPT